MQHQAITTEQNIKRYREQLDKIGFSFDWDRQVKTSEPSFYKWTQWIFVKLFHKPLFQNDFIFMIADTRRSGVAEPCQTLPNWKHFSSTG